MELLYIIQDLLSGKIQDCPTSQHEKEEKYSKKLITRLHDKYYDLTDFKHPGGPIPIALINNRDGTEMFE